MLSASSLFLWPGRKGRDRLGLIRYSDTMNWFGQVRLPWVAAWAMGNPFNPGLEVASYDNADHSVA
jgi:hypothetical protein